VGKAATSPLSDITDDMAERTWGPDVSVCLLLHSCS